MRKVDICIISFAKNEDLRRVTERCIETLLDSEKDIEFNIIVAESNPEINYDAFRGAKTIYPSKPFNYHKFLNACLSLCKSQYVALCNNDLTFEKRWASEIIERMEEDKTLFSASPLCPQTQSKGDSLLYYGYKIREHINGWCIFCKKELFDIIGKLPEEVDFWYSDNIYSILLQKHKIKHALVATSIVNHHSKMLGPTGILLEKDKMYDMTIGKKDIFIEKAKQIIQS